MVNEVQAVSHPKIFSYSTPPSQFLLGEKIKEYHIHYNVSFNFEEAYRDHNKRRFISDVYRYIIDKYDDIIKAKGIDEYYHEDGSKKYIYIHLESTDAKDHIKSMMNDLEMKYTSEWCNHQVPKLVSIIKNKLKSSRVIAQAVSHYQKRNGFNETQRALHVLHNDILSYDSDSDSD
jgi:hypothetical protein